MSLDPSSVSAVIFPGADFQVQPVLGAGKNAELDSINLIDLYSTIHTPN